MPVACWRPRRNRSDVCQHGADLTLHDLWRHAVSAPVRRNTGRNLAIRSRREVDDDEPATRFFSDAARL